MYKVYAINDKSGKREIVARCKTLSAAVGAAVGSGPGASIYSSDHCGLLNIHKKVPDMIVDLHVVAARHERAARKWA